MNKAIEKLSTSLDIAINEYTVKGESEGQMHAHRWYIACDDAKINAEDVGLKIDSYLMELNDDYLTERKHALKNVSVKLLPSKVFLEWMQLQGKYGSQSKFPRVLTNDKYIEWVKYISENNF